MWCIVILRGNKYATENSMAFQPAWNRLSLRTGSTSWRKLDKLWNVFQWLWKNRCLAVYDFQRILVFVSALSEGTAFEWAESYALLCSENHSNHDTVSGGAADFHGTRIYSGWKRTVTTFIADRWIWTLLVYAGDYEVLPDRTSVLAAAADHKR